MDSKVWYGFLIASCLAVISVISKVWRMYRDGQKRLIDLEYKNEKQKVKDAVKNDSIDTIVERISKRFGFRNGKD